jgi:glycosyltransferase involved in cell wall biosynthesis
VGDALAVLTPVVGLPSETFVARHATELAPGRTLTVASRRAPAPTWSVGDDDLVMVGGATPPAPIVRRARRLADRARGRAPGAWRWSPSKADLVALADGFGRHGVAVVLTEYLDTWLPLLPWLADQGLPVYAHSHGRDVSVRLRDPWWQERYLAYAGVAGVIAVSEHVRSRLVGLGLDGDRIHVIPCGVDVPDGVPVRPAGDDVVQALAIGRLVPKKHPVATVTAFARAAADDERLRLTMIGDGPLAGEVEAAVAASGVADRISLLGPQPHDVVLAQLQRADLFLQHSVVSSVDGDEEGLPVAVLEAMAAGAPVISTRHAGIPEAVVDGETGVLVGEGDVDAMAAAIAELAADADRRARLGRAGHARAQARFSWTRERDDLRRLLGLDAAVAR